MTARFGGNLDEKRLSLITRYKQIRNFTLTLCDNLEIEDFVIQPMPDASPTKWHLAHTSWFFETFVLCEHQHNFRQFNKTYAYLFNSYYLQAGERWQRPNRGLLARPTVKEVFDYRRFVDENMLNFLQTVSDNLFNNIFVLIETGLQHEQQHQELLITDLKNMFSLNPLDPIYSKKNVEEKNEISVVKWTEFNDGVYEIGHEGNSFFYDNEKPRHKVYLNKFKLANRLVTNKEYIEFIEDGGYQTPTLWLSEGIATVERENWQSPLYWFHEEGEWFNFTLSGIRKVNLAEPVCHVSYYEADAFARWAGFRLPTESEWEIAVQGLEQKGNFIENNSFHPIPLSSKGEELSQMFGDVWEWTSSDYSAYPGYKTPAGAIGEYNGKFMSNQIVLRGGSCATPESHIRSTYRNFFYHNQRWQFMGIRLAADCRGKD